MASGRSVAEVASLFGVGRKTRYRWRTQQATTGSLQPRQSTGRPRRLTAPQEAALVAQVEADPDLTLAELCATTPVTVSSTTMGRL
ncbi:MAG: helix-turn-helix domain-containing protein [Thermomicrobiales bacterium]|nr:helix-turn-helix domain-containing protein [Thermomicrobiales bacterium]